MRVAMIALAIWFVWAVLVFASVLISMNASTCRDIDRLGEALGFKRDKKGRWVRKGEPQG